MTSPDTLHNTLRQVFGLHEFRPQQQEIIENLYRFYPDDAEAPVAEAEVEATDA